MKIATSVQLVRCKIERIVQRKTFRGTPEATFQTPDGWVCCSVWFQGGKPLIQSRGSSMSPPEAALVGVAIRMALDWIAEERKQCR